MSEKAEPIIQYINGISYKLKEPFDFSFYLNTEKYSKYLMNNRPAAYVLA